MLSSDMPNQEPAFTFRAAQIFVAVVEAASVTRAAHQLGLSPSSVSQQLATLEAALGARLIERTARQFRLTAAGDLFLDPAKQLLDDVGAAKAKLALADQTPPMALRIASIEELDATVTAPWLIRMQTLFPNITFTLTSGASHENHSALASRSVDMTLAVDSAAEVDWVEQHPILRDPYVMITRAGSAADTTRPFVRYASGLLIGRQIEAQLRRTGTAPARGFEFSSNLAMFAMVAELDGWAITTALAVLGTPRSADILATHPLPLPRFARRLALTARSGALGALPGVIAGEMRSCLEGRILTEAEARLPRMDDGLQIIRNT